MHHEVEPLGVEIADQPVEALDLARRVGRVAQQRERKPSRRRVGAAREQQDP